MKLPKVFLLPLLVMILLAAYLGLRLRMPVSETEAISFFAQQYQSETGRPTSDCSALPSERDGVWIEVICIGPDLTGALYLVTRNGQLHKMIPMKAPQT
jgi:hypothetical protein